MKRIIAAFVNSVAGLKHGFIHEAAIRQEIIVLAIAIPLAMFFAPNAWHFLLLISVILLVLLVELLNTAIEALSDKITLEQSAHIKVAKDCGSAAVLIASLIAAGVWAITVWDYFIS